MEVKDVLEKYSRKIESEINEKRIDVSQISSEYALFKRELMPELSRYEFWAKKVGGMISFKLSLKDDERISKELAIAHLAVEPKEVVGLAVVLSFSLFFIGFLASMIMWFMSDGSLETIPLFFIGLLFIVSMFVFYYLYSMPSRLAIKWKLKAGSQMVPAILYAVIYMKHTSNLERAIGFIAEHIEAPLALDFRKILWDLETGRFSSIKDSLDNYLEFWKDSNIEFVESFHLIESSLYEPSEVRRVQILERALKIILDGVYEKMLKYTHAIKSPLTNIYMLGIVLPTLGLALLPLASTLLGGSIKSHHVFIFFNMIIPFFVFYLTSQILLKRPGGYGDTSLLEKNPYYYKYESKKPYVIASLICFPIFLLGILPLLFGYTALPDILGIPSDIELASLGLGFFGDRAFEFIDGIDGRVGPFGIVALLLSLGIPLSFSLFFIISFSLRTRDLIKARDETELLEKEFNSSLFSLGNRLGDGIPAEIAFAKVSESMKGQKTSEFFRIVNTNIQSMGMSLETAIFDPRRGALVYYPSNLIATSMRILIESAKKGLRVAAESLMSISEYVRNIQKINERLKDLLADVVSDMKSNMTFLAPLLAGIVIGLSSMITTILGKLKDLSDLGGEAALTGLGNLSNITRLFDINSMIPPYFMQVFIGLYIVEIIFILSGALVTIDSGEDRLRRTNDLAKNLLRGSFLYLIMACIAIIALFLLSSVALRGIIG